ncbi:hypothetical protein EMIT0373P_11520 [Pseudomonas chlororaphis]
MQFGLDKLVGKIFNLHEEKNSIHSYAVKALCHTLILMST